MLCRVHSHPRCPEALAPSMTPSDVRRWAKYRIHRTPTSLFVPFLPNISLAHLRSFLPYGWVQAHVTLASPSLVLARRGRHNGAEARALPSRVSFSSTIPRIPNLYSKLHRQDCLPRKQRQGCLPAKSPHLQEAPNKDSRTFGRILSPHGLVAPRSSSRCPDDQLIM